jgi:diguanylate cyclase (GGDEF)-like protein
MVAKKISERRAQRRVFRYELLAFIPAIGLSGIWYGWQGIALILGAAIAVAWLARGDIVPPKSPSIETPRDPLTGLRLRPTGETLLDGLLTEAESTGYTIACIVLGVDDAHLIAQQEGEAALNKVLQITAERLTDTLREKDIAIRLKGSRFGLLIQPTPRTDLASVIQLSARLQKAVEQPIALPGRTFYINAHIGFALSPHVPERTGQAMFNAAECAATEAAHNGPSAIRAFSAQLKETGQTRTSLTTEAANALESGHIIAYFQPQLSSHTGDIEGFNAVPRWMHPSKGILTENELLPAIDAAGLSDRLNEIMLFNALSALRGWDRCYREVESVSITLTSHHLTNPQLPDYMMRDLARFDIAPKRLRLVLPQTLIAELDDTMVSHNLRALHARGFPIEMSGFGTSSASVHTIRRACADRLRLHQSFTNKIDTDPDQQRIVSALISLAEGLHLETLAESVQTIGEHAMLTQIGCTLAQGPAIARPMGYDDTLEWIDRHRDKLKATPKLRRR